MRGRLAGGGAVCFEVAGFEVADFASWLLAFLFMCGGGGGGGGGDGTVLGPGVAVWTLRLRVVRWCAGMGLRISGGGFRLGIVDEIR